jgi:heavy metal sensor kinase
MRWSLRYGAATLLALSLLGVYLYQRVDRALRHDANLMLESELAELLDELGDHEGESRADIARMVEPELAAAHPELRFSFQIFDPQGHIRYGHGTLHDAEVPVPAEVLASPGTRAFREVDLGASYPYWVLAAGAGEDGSVQVGIYSRAFVKSARRIRAGFLATIPICVVVSAGLGFFFAQSSLRPVSAIVAAARRIRSENLDERIPTTGTGDEFDQIADSFNDVLDRIRSSMETLRRFTSDAAHQLRSPLTALRSRLEVTLETEAVPEEARKLLEEVAGDVASLAETIDAMLRLSRSEAGFEPGQRVGVDLEPLLRSVIEFFEPMAREQGLALRLQAQAHPVVMGDPSWLRQLAVNLVENAIRYADPGARVEVELGVRGDEAAISVRDTGRGIAPEQLERIFDRFHRVDLDAGSPGSGLGLPLAQKIAVAHGGAIDVESALGRGSTFTVRLPLPA